MTTTSNINIVIKEDGSRVVKRNLHELGEDAEFANKAVESLKHALEAVVAAEAVRAIVEMVNQYQELHNQLLFVTTSQGNLNAVFAKLTEVAAETHTSLADNVGEYTQLTQATHDLGLSQQQVIEFQTRLNEAVKLSGINGRSGADAVNALSKSLTTGRLEGAVFTRTLQQVPIVGDILAKSLGVTRGQLKDLAVQGELSAMQLVDAFEKMGPKLDKQFKGIKPTIGEAFDELKDQLTVAVGTFAETTGAGALFANTIKDVGEFVKNSIPYVVGFGQALLGTLSPSTQLTSGMKVFASILVILFGSLQLVANMIITGVVGGFKAVGQVIGGLGAAIVAWAEGIIDEFKAVIEGIGAIPHAIELASKGDFAGAGKAIADAFSGPWDEAGKDFDRSAAALNDTMNDLGHNIVDNLKEQFDNVVNSGKGMWDKLDKIWDAGARDLQTKQAPVGQVNTKAGKNVTTQFSAAEIDKTRKELEQVLAQFDSIHAAELKLAKDEEILAKAQKEGIITKQQSAMYLKALIEHYKDILDPIGAYVRTLEQETNLLKYNADQRQIETTLLQKELEWKQKGIPVSQQEIANIRAKLEAQQALNKVVAQQDALLAGSASEQAKTQKDQLNGMQNLLNDKKSGFNKNDATNALSQQNPDLFANTQEQFAAQSAKYQGMYDQIDAMRQRDLISEKTASGMRVKVWAQQQNSQLATQQQFFGDLSQLQKSSNTKIAAVGKAAAIAQAMINTYQAATAAYASLASIPYVGPALGAAAAAAAIVSGLASVAQIRNQPTGFMTGGSFEVPGATGGADSQMVAFRATPGERVSIATPAQVRKGDAGTAGSAANAPAAPVNQRIINIFDPAIVGDYLGTADGEQVLVNVLHRNADVVKTIAGTSHG